MGLTPPVHCTTCAALIPPGRAALGYTYCISEACVRQNFRPLKIIAVGVNKSIPVLTTEAASPDLATRAARGELHDQRRASFGTPTRATPPEPARPSRTKNAVRRPSVTAAALPGTPALRRLAALYIAQGLTPQQASTKLLGKLTPRQVMQCAPRRSTTR